MNSQSEELFMSIKRSIMSRYECRRENLLDILLDLQEVCPGRCLDEETAKWVARQLGVTETKVAEALTFYAMLHTEPQARFVLEICSSTPCFFTKTCEVAEVVSRELGIQEGEISEDGLFAFRFVPCFGACAEGPAIKLGDEIYGNMTEDSVKALIERCRSQVTSRIQNVGPSKTGQRMSQPRILLKRAGQYQDPTSVKEYLSLGGFSGLRRTVEMEKIQALEEIDTAMLRGRGGAAYPAGRKWKHLFGIEAEPKYIVCNGDEGEPGTFKDRLLLEQDPFSVLEGMLIAAYIFGAESAYIFIRGEYRHAQEVFRRAVKSAEEEGYGGENIMGIPGFSCRIHVVSGAGAYVCGENSALLNTIEGKTGRPRVKPPHLAEFGLYLKPTLVNNVESFACVPAILTLGGQAFLEVGTEDGGGTKLVCLSGHAKNRGVFEVPLGTPMQEVLYGSQYGGGTASGRPIQFCHFGGQSGPIGFPEQLDGLFSYQGLWDKGLAMGTGAVVVMDDSVDLVEYVRQVVAFFVHESCGKCTPCRLGTMRMLECLNGGSLERLEEIIEHVTNLSACGLGQTAGYALGCALKYRRELFENL